MRHYFAILSLVLFLLTPLNIVRADEDDSPVLLEFPTAGCKARECEYENFNFPDFDSEDEVAGSIVPFCAPGTAPDSYKIKLNLTTKDTVPIYPGGPLIQCKSCLASYASAIENKEALSLDEDGNQDALGCFYTSDSASIKYPCISSSLEFAFGIDKLFSTVDFGISLPNAGRFSGFRYEDGSTTLNLDLRFANLHVYADTDLTKVGNNFFVDCSQALTFKVTQSTFGDCGTANGTITLTPQYSNTSQSTLLTEYYKANYMEAAAARNAADEQCKQLPKDAEDMTVNIQTCLAQLASVLESSPSPAQPGKKSQPVKIEKSSAQSLSKSLKNISSLLKRGEKKGSPIKEFFPSLSERQILNGQTAIKAGKKNFTTKTKKTLLNLSKHLESVLKKLEEIIDKTPAESSLSSERKPPVAAARYCRPPSDGENPPLPPANPPIPDNEKGILSGQPFEYCLGTNYELDNNALSCAKNEAGEVIEVMPSKCTAPGSGLPFAVCSSVEECQRTAYHLEMTSHPVVATDNCRVAARDWCSNLARRLTHEGSDVGCPAPQRITFDYSTEENARGSKPFDRPEGCQVSYPRFPAADSMPYCVRLSDRTYAEFRSEYDGLKNSFVGLARFAYNGVTYLFDTGEYLVSLGEKNEDGSLEDFSDPNKYGLPIPLATAYANSCMQFDKVWDAMACISQRVKSGYDKEEIRLQNNNGGDCGRSCLVCRHYGSTFTQVCNILTAQKGWAGKVECKNGRNSVHLWSEISVKHNGELYNYVYDVLNDPGCVDVVAIDKPFVFIPEPNLK